MASARVLVTGAKSLIGSHILDDLLTRNLPVRAVVNSHEEQQRLGLAYPERSHLDLDFAMIPLSESTSPGAFDRALHSGAGPFHTVIHAGLADPFGEADCLARCINLKIESTIHLLRSIVLYAPTVRRVVLVSSLSPFARWLSEPEEGRSPHSTRSSPSQEAASDPEYVFATSQASDNIVYDALRKWMHENRARFDLVSVTAPSVYGPSIWPLGNSADLEEANRYIWNICSSDSRARSTSPPNGIDLYADVRDLAFASVQAALLPQAGNRRFSVAAGHIPSRIYVANLISERFPYFKGRLQSSLLTSRSSPRLSVSLESVDTHLTRGMLGLTRYRSVEHTLIDVAVQIEQLHHRRDWRTVIQS